jgi:hypothetical protein
MNATHITFISFRKSNNGFFLYYIPCKQNKCWKNFKIMRKSLFNYSFYSHPEIGNFRVWQVPLAITWWNTLWDKTQCVALQLWSDRFKHQPPGSCMCKIVCKQYIAIHEKFDVLHNTLPGLVFGSIAICYASSEDKSPCFLRNNSASCNACTALWVSVIFLNASKMDRIFHELGQMYMQKPQVQDTNCKLIINISIRSTTKYRDLWLVMENWFRHTCTNIHSIIHKTNSCVQDPKILILCRHISSKERLHLLFARLIRVNDITKVWFLVLISKAEQLVYWLDCVDDIF